MPKNSTLVVTVTVGGQPAVGYYVTLWSSPNGTDWAEVVQDITDDQGIARLVHPAIPHGQQGRLAVAELDAPAPIYYGPVTDTVAV